MKKILILHNSAPGYSKYFIKLGSKLKYKGFSIIHAFSSECEYEKSKRYIEDEYYILRAVKSNDIVNKYSHYNLNNALFSDVERATYYSTGFNWSNKNNVDLLKSSLLSFFETIISEHKVDYVLYENVSNSFAYYSWFVCQELGVRYVGLIQSRLPGRFSITSTPLCGREELIDLFNQLKNQSIEPEPYLDEYLGKLEHTQPDYMITNNSSQTNVFKKYRAKGVLDKTNTIFLSGFNRCIGSYQLRNYFKYFFSIFVRDVGRAVKLRRLSSYYDDFSLSETYYLYPLHFHPESSTSVLASVYVDELNNIKNIANNLPHNAYLYVKDHPSAAGYPSMRFYHELKKIHNVKVLDQANDTKRLIKGSLAVITVTGTTGYEALLLGKKVFVLGEVFFDFHVNVRNINNLKCLFAELSDIELVLNGDDLDRYNYRFLYAYFKSTSEGLFNIKDINTIGTVAESLVDALKCDV